jgi:hypothetical protein
MLLKRFLIFILFSSAVVNAHAYPSSMSCRNILFFAEAFDRFKIQIQRMNDSGLIRHIILVTDSPLLSSIRHSRIEEVKEAVAEIFSRIPSASFFDEIAVAIALGQDDIARYLFEQSTFDYRRTPLGKDLLMTAVYWGNARMLSFLDARGVTFASPERARALQYARMTRSNDILHFLMGDLQ